MSGHQNAIDDDIKPSEIEHKCEVIVAGAEVVERYNYFVYHFDCAGRYFWAKAYIDDISTVSVYGPFDGRETRRLLPGVVDEAVLSYLKRRFTEIQTLGEAGYITIWAI